MASAWATAALLPTLPAGRRLQPAAGLLPRQTAALQRLSRPGLTTARGPATLTCRATAAVEQNGATSAGATIPTPVVKIDNQHDPFATLVFIEYGDRLGELLDTIAALRNLNLNIRRAKIKPVGESGTAVHKFYITDARTSEKILKSARLEEIRLTILNNLLKYHPESGEELGWGVKAKKPSLREATTPLGPRNRQVVDTVIELNEDEGSSHSELYVETLDRPGLLVEIVRVLKDINVNVISAEVDTEGKLAKDTLYITYHGEPLNSSMQELVRNALQYYLAMGQLDREEAESY